MSVSSVAGLQREKEAKALRYFLALSIMGSLVLHIGVLASGAVNLLARTPKLEEEPIELTFVEPETPETRKPQPESVKKAKISVVKPEPQPSLAVKPRVETPVQPKRETTATPVRRSTPQLVKPEPIETRTFQQPVAKVKPIAAAPSPNTGFKQTAQKSVPQNSSSRTSNALPTHSRENSQPSGGGGGSGSSISQVGETGTGNGILTGRGAGLVSRGGTSSGTGSGTGSGIIATAPTTPKISVPVSPPSSIPGSRKNSGRAACRQCDARYPEQARRKGIEGRVEVAVDTDKDGNVTNVRLLRSSGNRELDEAHLRQAREWKLKPSEGGRQGVAIATEYAIKGSRRYREVQERKRAREREQQRNEQPVAARMNTAEQISSFRQRLQATSGNNTDVPTSSRRRRRRLVETPSQQTATSRSTQSSFSRQSQTQTEETVSRRRSLVESLRRNRKNSVESNSAKTSQATSNRGRRRREQPESNNSSAERLRNALRNSRLRSAPSVTAPAAPSQGSDE